MLQRSLAGARARGEIGDVVLLLEHPPVYTMGRNGSAAHVPSGVEHLRALGAEYVDVDRGGVGDVPRAGATRRVSDPADRRCVPDGERAGHGDVVEHLRAMEEALIATVAAHDVIRRPPSSVHRDLGGGQKLAAIGVKLALGVTTHGAALNVTTDLEWFDEVIPCGIEGAGVASLASLGVRPAPRLHDVAVRFATELARVAGRQPKRAGDAVRAAVAEASAVPV